MSDCPQLVPLVDGVGGHLGRMPKEVSADAGYCSEDNLSALAARGVAAYIAIGRAKRSAGVNRKIGGALTQRMRRKLKLAGRRSRYRLRKQIVEPVLDTSSRRAAFDSSCCAASKPCGRNGP
jgi:hypothetical protein